MKRTAGFTLIELLVTITVVAVLISAAVPSFKTTIQNGRITSQTNDFLGALLIARSQAIAINSDVVVCASSDGATCANSTDWNVGWLVGPGTPSAITSVLRVHEALVGNNTLQNDLHAKSVVFTAGSGVPKAGTEINFSLCDSRGEANGRSIYLSFVGEARVSPTAGKQIDNTTDLDCTP
ncbi:MAG TPA: GspH/FimT family pseudopilin [Gammaproteobacteria bacterium]